MISSRLLGCLLCLHVLTLIPSSFIIVSVYTGKCLDSCFFVSGNILALEDRVHTSADQLMLIDFEYSSYNYR